MVNRVWQHHFGEGLVKTTSDFGRAGSAPSHLELLDWLAAEFIESGWSLKRLHKLIMLSATYQQSSCVTNERGIMVDPGNRLLWRQNLRRLEAEVLRDNVLTVSGTLNTRTSGRGFFPHLAGEVLAGQSRPGLDWDVSTPGEQSRRSIYAFVRRTMGVPLFEAFDYNNTTSPLPERPITTVAPQALMLLNDDFMQEQAQAFAARIVKETGRTDGSAQVRKAYAVAFQRAPSEGELETALGFISRNDPSFCELSGRQTFKVDVANALSTEYFAKLEPSQFLNGPSDGWAYYRGAWAPPYEAIRVVVREQGPFALRTGPTFANGTIETDLELAKSAESAGILLRVRAEADSARGYEIVFAPRAKEVRLLKHTGESVVLATAPATLTVGTPFHVKIEFEGNRIRLWIDRSATAALDVVDENAAREGAIGVRPWGGLMNVANLRVSMQGSEPVQVASRSADPGQRALESFCLLMLNLNEMIYID
jgi:hypothetical protein